MLNDYLLLIIKAAITPGTQPAKVSKHTRINDPQPLSIMAKGGKIIHSNTLQIDIQTIFFSSIQDIQFLNDIYS